MTKGGGGVPRDLKFVFRAFYYSHLSFFHRLFSNCLTVGYASFDAKQFQINPVVFSLISIIAQYQKMLGRHFKMELSFFFKCYFSNGNLFMFSYFEPNFIEKFLLGKCFFKFWPKIKMTQKKKRLFGRHLKRHNISNFL